jgi:hypothetical protein
MNTDVRMPQIGRGVISPPTLVVVFLIIVAALLQFSIPTLVDADSYLHIRMAEFLRTMGPHYDFHWARFSTFSDHFSDKDLLFHALLVPFTFFPSIITGAKWAAVFNTGLSMCMMALYLRLWGGRRAVVPGLCLLMSSQVFMFELLRLRSFGLVIACIAGGIYLLLERRYLLLAVLTALSCLTHVSGPYMLLYALVVETVRRLTRRSFDYKNVLAVLGGVAAGLLVHPHFPDNVYQFYLNAIQVPLNVLSKGGVLEKAIEMHAPTLGQLMTFYPLLFAGLLLCAVLFLRLRPALSLRTLATFALAGVGLVCSMASYRYMTYTWPLFVLFFAGFCHDMSAIVLDRDNIRRRVTQAIVVSAVICWIAQLPMLVSFLRMEQARNSHYESMARIMQKVVPAGEPVFHTNWSDSQFFIGLNPANDYFMTFDPVYMYAWNQELYSMYRNVAFGHSDRPFAVLRELFGVQYGYAGKRFFGFVGQVKSSPGVDILAEDEQGLLFIIRDGGGK